MSLTVKVGGEDVTSRLLENTFVLTNALGQRDTLACSLISPDGTYCPGKGVPVVVTHSDLGHQFGGTIRAAQISEYGGPVVSTIQCASWEQIMSRRLVGQIAFVDQPAGDVFSAIFTGFLTFEDLTASVIETGPNITITFDNCSVYEAFDQICAMASQGDDVYIWDCRNRVTRFYSQASFAAPFDVTDDQVNVARPMTVQWDFSEYANRIMVRVPEFTTEPRTQEFAGDGAATEFNCDLPLALAPTVVLLSRAPDISGDQAETFTADSSPVYYTSRPITSVTHITVNGSVSGALSWSAGSPALTVSGLISPGDVIEIVYQYDLDTTSPTSTPQTVGILGVDTGKQWYWEAGSSTITQDAGGSPLSFPQRLSVTFQGTQATVVDAGQDDDAVTERSVVEGGSGWYMRLIEASKPGVLADAVALGQAELSKRKRIPLTVEYRTDYGGIRAGMHQRIASSKFGDPFDATFLIESSTLVQEGCVWFWKIRAVSGALAGVAGGWLQKLRRMQDKSGTGLGVTTITSASDTGAVTINGIPVTY